jgi:hypothetical protein
MSFFYMQLLFPRADPNLICFTYFPRPYPIGFPLESSRRKSLFCFNFASFSNSNMTTYRNEIRGAR